MSYTYTHQTYIVQPLIEARLEIRNIMQIREWKLQFPPWIKDIPLWILVPGHTSGSALQLLVIKFFHLSGQFAGISGRCKINNEHGREI